MNTKTVMPGLTRHPELKPRYRLKIFAGMTCVVLCLALSLTACGGGGSSVIPAQAGIQNELPTSSTSPDPSLQRRGASEALDSRARFWEPMIRSVEYTGQLAVMFKENAGVRFGAGVNTFRSKFNTNLKPLNDLMAQHPEATVRLGLPDIDQDFLDSRIAEIRDVEGYPMTDWASFYIIDVMDADEAMEMLNGLVQLSDVIANPAGVKQSSEGGLNGIATSPSAPRNDIVWFTHPIPRAHPTGIQIPNISPGPGQDYLKDVNSTGGLNVKAAWDANLDGTGIVEMDLEGGWNVNHLDLPLTQSSYYVKSKKPDTDVQHGTAVAGVVAGKNNGIGITGMAPNSTFKLIQDGDGIYFTGILSMLITSQAKYADSDIMKPGDLLIIEEQLIANKGSVPNCDSTATNPSNGCVPVEAYDTYFAAFKDMVNYGGIVIVEGSGNGGLNLDNYNLNAGTGVDFAKDNSGAIMVGASMGGSTLLNGKHTLEKAPFSNCGSRVDVFAWGTGVVTTGYGDHAISVTQTASTPGAMKVDPALLNGASKYVDPNQAYTASFAGTSSATAIIAGSAALLQQYAKQLYTDPKGACVIKTWEYVYLSSQQMRDVMVKSGTPAKPYNADAQMWNGYKDPNPGCTIGTQPDLGKAMQLIKDGCDGKPNGVKATVKTKDLTTYCPKATLSNPTPKKQSWCPDYGPLQPAIGKMMDMDGDGRADLISFSKDRKWVVDLSTVGPTQFSGMPFPSGKPKDNFGTWNLVFDLSGDTTLAKDAMLFPVVMDYNTDGKADLSLYDSVHGKWVVLFTTGNTLNTNTAVNGINPWPGWDMVIDYSTQPHWKPYSRPVPGDYDGQDNDPYTFDHYMDLALQTPDGWWLIDFGGANPKANYGSFDQMEQYLVNGVFKYSVWDGSKKVSQQINDVPGWGYLPVVYLASYDNNKQFSSTVVLKTPDNLTDSKQSNLLFEGNAKTMGILGDDFTYPFGQQYSGNDTMLSQGRYQTNYYADIGFKKIYPGGIGLWQVATNGSGWGDLINIDPYVDFGDIRCRPVTGDFDGDGYDDRAVQCDNIWKIAYTGSKYPINSNKQSTYTLDGKQVTVSETFRIINLSIIQDPLPGYVYPGGVSFKDTKDIFATVDYLCPTVAPNGSNPPCSLLTMTPAPIGPYFPQCVDAVKKQYASDPCLDPNKKVACETMRVQQAQCVYQ